MNELAAERGQTLAQMAVAWVLRHPAMTSALIGASRVEQVEDAVAALAKLEFTEGELETIDEILEGWRGLTRHVSAGVVAAPVGHCHLGLRWRGKR